MKKNERGQSLVIIAISFLALVAMAALVIDGGSLYLNRRNAQTAADAAALAGARELCVNKGTDGTIQNIVDEYAITENGATAVENVDIDFINKTVNVQTMLETSSFFAGILGYENNTVRAEASAGCFPPSEMNDVLPIAWTCRPPEGGSQEDGCTVHSIPWTVFQILYPAFENGLSNKGNKVFTVGEKLDDPIDTHYSDDIGGKTAYIVMDDDKFDPHKSCQPYIGDSTALGTINCDFNNDGILDVEGGANRGWLYLGVKQSDKKDLKAKVKDVMRDGYPGSIIVPQWFPGEDGTIASVFKEANDYRLYPRVSLVPIFNAVCDAYPTTCSTEFKNNPIDLIGDSNGKPTYYRVAGFAPFVVTCVSGGNAPEQKCPVKTYANLDGNAKTIEGYFVSGYTGGMGIDLNGFDLGVYVISLTK